MLDCKNIYIDTRFKTADSRSDSDCFVELPNTVNIPDNCVCYIDDIVIPVSWNTVDARNNQLYVRIDYLVGVRDHHFNEILTVPIRNYSGPTFAVALETTLNNAFFTSPNTKFTVTWSIADNTLTMAQIDNWDKVIITIVSDADISSGILWDHSIRKDSINSVNGIMRSDELQSNPDKA